MTRSVKQAVNLSVDRALLHAARAHEINLSATLEAALAHELRERQRAQWLKGNADAIGAYNADVDAHGTFSDRVRGF